MGMSRNPARSLPFLVSRSRKNGAGLWNALFSPAGRSAEPREAMRGLPARPEQETNRSFGAPPHPTLRATFSPLARRGKRAC